ncbi:hypothetical protein OG787_50170 [Streptomyces sp. NBC_00075]|uniref:hypothetical protein n=1 Tax=Streptomyces sp. NBC_00075 TaxID=2975641 RepID=UPI0032496B3B
MPMRRPLEITVSWLDPGVAPLPLDGIVLVCVRRPADAGPVSPPGSGLEEIR